MAKFGESWKMTGGAHMKNNMEKNECPPKTNKCPNENGWLEDYFYPFLAHLRLALFP